MTAGPPRRPPVSITPMAAPTVPAARLSWLVAACWFAALVLILAPIADLGVHRRAVAHRLAIVAVGDSPGTDLDRALQAANIALAGIGVLAVLTVALAGVGLYRLLRRHDRWRGWLVAAAIGSVAYAGDIVLTIASTPDLESTGVTPQFVWAALPGAVVATIGTGAAFVTTGRR